MTKASSKIIRDALAKHATIRLECYPEDVPPKGYCSAIDDETDAATELWIEHQLNTGNQWAWCMVKVTAEWRDFSAYDTLCACSYESEEAFRADGYYADMAATALNELAERIESAKESVDALILHNDSRPKRSDNHGGVTCEINIEHGEQLRAQREQIETLERALRAADSDERKFATPAAPTSRHAPLRVRCLYSIVTADNELIPKGTSGTVIGWKFGPGPRSKTIALSPYDHKRHMVMVAWDAHMYFEVYDEKTLGTEDAPTPFTITSPLHCEIEHDSIEVV